MTPCSLTYSFPLSRGWGRLVIARCRLLSPLNFVLPMLGPHDGETKKGAAEDKKKNTHSRLLLSL
jgi:hypothetical protein